MYHILVIHQAFSLHQPTHSQFQQMQMDILDALVEAHQQQLHHLQVQHYLHKTMQFNSSMPHQSELQKYMYQMQKSQPIMLFHLPLLIHQLA